jgi:hypothetical protein
LTFYYYWKSHIWLNQIKQFRYSWADLRQQLSLTTDFIRYCPELFAQPEFSQNFTGLQRLSLNSFEESVYQPIIIKKLHRLDDFLNCFTKKHQLAGYQANAEAFFHVDLPALWQAGDELMVKFSLMQCHQTPLHFVFCQDNINLSQYLESGVQHTCWAWRAAGGLYHYENQRLEFTLSLMNMKQDPISSNSVHGDEDASTDQVEKIQTLLEKLALSQDISEQLTILVDCFKHMGFEGAEVQNNHQRLHGFGDVSLPVQWQTNIQSQGLWHIKLHNQGEISPLHGAFLHAIGTQMQAVQDSLRQFSQSPHLLLELYEVSRVKDNISYIEASRGYSVVHFSSNKAEKTLTLRLRRILTFFEQQHFIQIHRSILVNPQKIINIEFNGHRNAKVFLKGKELMVSKKYLNALKDWTNQDTY